MKKIIYIFFIGILIQSCTSRTIYKKPKDLIERNRMIDLWTDMYIAKGAYSVKTKDSRKNINYIPLVLKKYNIDSVQFSKSNIYYTSRIDEYEKMFQEVHSRLTEIKKVYQPAPKRDSLILKELRNPDGVTNKESIKKLQQKKLKD